MHKAGKDKQFQVYPGWGWEDSEPSYLLGGELLALPKRARHKELAKELMLFLVSREIQKEFINALSWPSVRVDVIPTEVWQQIYLQQINKALLHAEPVPEYWWPDMQSIYRRLFTRIVDSKTRIEDIDSILRSFQNELQKRVPECRSLRP